MAAEPRPPDLIATSWLTAGNAAPMRGDERSPEKFEDRVAAAREAGFTGFGLLTADLVPLRDEIGYDGIRSILDSSGIQHLELEFLTDWFVDGVSRQESDRVREILLEAAAELGARHIKAAGTFNGVSWPLDVMVSEYRTLARQAAASGTRIALEPTPLTNIETPADGLRIVEQADFIQGGGLLLDVWHVARADIPMSELGSIPVETLVHAEINDGAAEVVGTLFEDTINNRRYPGEGELGVVEFIRVLVGNGYDGTWGLEIISEDVRSKPVATSTREAYRAAIEVLNAAGLNVR